MSSMSYLQTSPIGEHSSLFNRNLIEIPIRGIAGKLKRMGTVGDLEGDRSVTDQCAAIVGDLCL